MGGVSDPVNFIKNDIIWVNNQISSHNWPAPSKFSFEAYACYDSWAIANIGTGKKYTDLYNAYYDMFNTAATQAGGWNRILIEEIGVNHGDSAQDGVTLSCTNDYAEGQNTYSASLSVIANVAPNVPVGIWDYYDINVFPLQNGLAEFCDGLIKTGGVKSLGWWVPPYFFK